ncbi:hypothetical protein SOVF_162990 [Spinacia oleracea]|nr:hypothetical protein SOVF_162990 [Spinacia oleracea]
MSASGCMSIRGTHGLGNKKNNKAAAKSFQQHTGATAGEHNNRHSSRSTGATAVRGNPKHQQQQSIASKAQSSNCQKYQIAQLQPRLHNIKTAQRTVDSRSIQNRWQQKQTSSRMQQHQI